MSNLLVEKSIKINAPVSKVWQVFTNPVITRQMGGEYVSDWKAGSGFGWMAADGKMLTNGTILQIEPEKLLKHNLLNSDSATISIITYELRAENGRTILDAREDFTNPITDEEYSDAINGWDAALAALKDVAEK